MVTDIIAKFAKSDEKRLQNHIDIEASRLLSVNDSNGRNHLNLLDFKTLSDLSFNYLSSILG
jgi:hypothetical protein